MQKKILELFKGDEKDLSILKSVGVISLVLFASLIAPKMPASYLEIIDNKFVKFLLFTSIAYLATCDLVSAIIASIAVMVTLQTLSVHRITNKIISETKDLLESQPVQMQTPEQPVQTVQIQSSEPTIQTPIQMQSSEPTIQTPIQMQSSEPTVQNLQDDQYLKLQDFLNKLKKTNPLINQETLYNVIMMTNPNLDTNRVKNLISSTFNQIVDQPVQQADQPVIQVEQPEEATTQIGEPFVQIKHPNSKPSPNPKQKKVSFVPHGTLGAGDEHFTNYSSI